MGATRLVLVTGSAGLIGSEAVSFFCEQGWKACGIDNNMRRDFFGVDGDTSWNRKRLKKLYKDYKHHDFDIRNRRAVMDLVESTKPDLIIHAAAQPSHDLAAKRVFDDFDINAVGTLNLLEAVRNFCAESPFIFMSTNKVYGDAPNEIPLVERETRFDYERPEDLDGIDESCRVDACLHSLFGASKIAADILVQEYGRYFDMPTVCLRGSCLSGPNHSGAELHGFLAYLAKCVKEKRTYKIIGYKGKQVRDNIHAFDVCTIFLNFFLNPQKAAVYNLGGGRANSISVLEAISKFEAISGRRLKTEYIDTARVGDHVCYISNMNKFKKDYPEWEITRSLDNIIQEFLEEPVLV